MSNKISKRNKSNVNKDVKPSSLIDKIKNFFYFLGVLGIGFIIIFCLIEIGGWIDNKEVQKINENKSITSGIIIKVGSYKGSYAIAEYYVSGKRFEKKEGSYADDVEVDRKSTRLNSSH